MKTFALFMALALGAAAADKIVGGPYVVNVGPRSATVAWVVETGEVRLMEAGAAPVALPVLRVEKAGYARLTAGKTYNYTAANGMLKGTFKTPPAGDAKFQFSVFGDTRTRHDMHKKVIEAMMKHDMDFIIHTGDLVQDGTDTPQWPIFFDIEKRLLAGAAFFPVLGNHERNSPQYYDFFDVKIPYYSFQWGQAYFICLNSDFGNAERTASARDRYFDEQTRWLEDELKKAQKAALRFAVFHHPPFTAVKTRQTANEPPVRKWVPLFEKYKVQAVFNGHDHNYQHHVVNGIDYIVTGGGGAPLYPVDGAIEGTTRKVESIENFVIVKVDGKTARSEALALDGRVIEAIEWK
jgi:acid phosphatase type 7